MELTVIGINSKGKKLTLVKYGIDMSMYVGRHKVPVSLIANPKDPNNK